MRSRVVWLIVILLVGFGPVYAQDVENLLANGGFEDGVVAPWGTYGGVTSAMRTFKRGEMVGVRGPFGNPWPIEKLGRSDVVLVAGGIGVAPLRPVLYHILAHREKYGTQAAS